MIAPILYETKLLLIHSNCPNCFGVDLCESLTNGSIQLNWLSKFLLILHPKLTKSVFFGSWNSSRAVVLKSMTKRGQYRVKNYKLREGKFFEDVYKEYVFVSDEVIQNVVVCPNVRSLPLLFGNVDRNLTNLIINHRLWFDLHVSIEPLLLKFLSSIEGMPVPAYHGACGDVIVKEFKGKALNNYYSHNWVTRAFLSVQLLKMAETFTFHHESLIFYFTDVSPDNIAVDELGMIYLTDLDHVIIAERKHNCNGNTAEEGLIHVSEVLDPVKLTITPSQICEHPLSDHNYFAVCRNILMHSEEMNQGLLSDIPRNVEDAEALMELLEECSIPKKHSNRITAGRLLGKLLRETMSDFKWKTHK